MQLAYLRGYFSSEFLGRGMPEIRGVQSALTILGSIRGQGSDHARNLFMIPTVPTAFDLALSGGGTVEEFAQSVMGSSRGQSSIGSLSLMGSGGGSSVGGSSVGPSASSVGSTLTAESLQAVVAAEIAKALGTSAQ
eukprot:1184790-Prymnesium_polylepis.1